MANGNSVVINAPGESSAASAAVTTFMTYPAAGLEQHGKSEGVSRSAASFNNMRVDRFNSILQTIQHMSRVPYGHPVHIDVEVAKHALDVVAALNHHFEVSPPKIFPMDDENLVLEWSFGPIGRYMTISADDLSILEKNLKTNVKCFHDIGPDGEKGYPRLRVMLNAPLVSSVTTAVDNAG